MLLTRLTLNYLIKDYRNENQTKIKHIHTHKCTQYTTVLIPILQISLHRNQQSLGSTENHKLVIPILQYFNCRILGIIEI